jgi:hypothetical protein
LTATNCTSCQSQYKLIPIIGENRSICSFNCDPNCLKCQAEGLCEICVNANFYLYVVSETEKVCKEKTKVSFSLVALVNPRMFKLSFSHWWPELFDNITIKIEHMVSNVSPENFTCLTSKDSSTNKEFIISCNYKTNISSDSTLSIKINNYPPNTDKSSHFLDSDSASVKLSKYIFCGDGVAWREGE